MSATATVIIPTFGYAPYIRQAIKSAQAQITEDLEICVICDGSPPEMLDLIKGLAEQDSRIMVFVRPKDSSKGESHRHQVILETTGKIICYLCHDDLWFPRHVAIMERLLSEADFAHTMHVYSGLGPTVENPRNVLLADISLSEFKRKMIDPGIPTNYFGLTFGAHTREAYFRLPEGWTRTPKGIWTDLHMWRKFLSAPWCRCVSHLGITALHFENTYWSAIFSAEDFEKELEICLLKMATPDFLENLTSLSMKKSFLDFLNIDNNHLRAIVRETIVEVLHHPVMCVTNEAMKNLLRQPEMCVTNEAMQNLLHQPEMCVTNEAMQNLLHQPEMCVTNEAMQNLLHQPEMCVTNEAMQNLLHQPEMCVTNEAMQNLLHQPEMCVTNEAMRSALLNYPGNDLLTRLWRRIKKRLRKTY